jgi:hypothetical protein
LIVSQRIANDRHGWPPSYNSNSKPFESYNAIGRGATGWTVALVFSDSDSCVVIIIAPPFLAGIALSLAAHDKARRFCDLAE